ncbi:MAG: TauD/TfdA family dioxygenase [Pseudomonadota bacterium]
MTMVANKVQVRKLTGAVGAEISGVNLAKLDDDEFGVIHKAFHDHGMLVFREQFVDPVAQVAFARRFGDVMVYKGFEKTYRADLPEGMFHFSNDGKEKVITERWHFDGTFYEAPPAIGILAPDRLPAHGGDTMWSNQYVAYERLSDGMKKLLGGLRTVCESHRSSRKYDLEVMSAVQPAVRRHPVTGRLSLYIGDPQTCTSFVGMTKEESSPLINYLYEQACQPDNSYRHSWRLGDVVMWDNRCTMHYAIHDYGTQPRDMYRMTINGEPNRGPVDE